eukprot:356064-Chlamydomonas_euryale.AAC.6
MYKLLQKWGTHPFNTTVVPYRATGMALGMPTPLSTGRSHAWMQPMTGNGPKGWKPVIGLVWS